MKNSPAINDLLAIMARLRAPNGCPWDREQDHRTLREHAIEEVYELIDAIDAGDDHEMMEELGDLLLQVVFHCQLAAERGAFDFEQAARHIADKLIRRHPHVFGDKKVKNVDEVWANWEKIKAAEKRGTIRERASVYDGIPRRLPALMRAQKLLRKRAKIQKHAGRSGAGKAAMARKLFELAAQAQGRGWSAEDLLRGEVNKNEAAWRREEQRKNGAARKKSKRKSG